MASISQIKLPNNSVYDIKAKYDISGNIISDTYLRKDFDSIGHNVSFNSSVDIDDLTAGTLLVTGAARFTNGLIGNLKGTASNVPWSGITGKPSTYTPSAHTHIMANITDWGAYVYSAQGTRTKNTVLAAPNGSDGKATFRSLVPADIPSLDASKITSGVFDIARLPQGALERLTIVADDTARFKLTSSNIQKGDTVKVTSTGKMYYVIDETKLSSEAGYEVYAAGTAASVPWSGVTSKPTTLSGYGITDALSSSTKYALSDSVGGNALKANLLANLFSSRPENANVTVTGSGGLATFKATSSMTTNRPKKDGHILHFYWDNTRGYDSQLIVTNGNNPELQIRGQEAGTWGAWKTVLSSNNYTDYVPKKDGTGASGTWGIDITGNAKTATSADSATKATHDGAGNVITSKYVTIDTTQTISGSKTFSKETTISSATASTNKTTGALKVKGGIASEGQMSADKVMIGDKCTLEYDANLQCLNFVFA